MDHWQVKMAAVKRASCIGNSFLYQPPSQHRWTLSYRSAHLHPWCLFTSSASTSVTMVTILPLRQLHPRCRTDTSPVQFIVQIWTKRTLACHLSFLHKKVTAQYLDSHRKKGKAFLRVLDSPFFNLKTHVLLIVKWLSQSCFSECNAFSPGVAQGLIF